MNNGRRKMPGPRPVGNRDKDEDLMLFKEMQKREKDRAVSLLQPVSDEFEANGHYALYGMPPTGKKQGHDVLGGDTGKNDYDWLKTPPATPLFPSLEMESHGPELVTQRELPISQPLSRFSGNSEAEKVNNSQPTKSQNLKTKDAMRYSTPTGRPNLASLPEKKNVKSAPVASHKLNQSYNDLNLDQNPRISSSTLKTAEKNDADWNLLATNLSKSMNKGLQDSSTKVTKPQSRGVSPVVRSQIPAKFPELSDETPANLRTNRSISASASRPRSVSGQQQNPSSSQKRPESVNKTRRQTSSPGSARGRKQDLEGNLGPQSDRTRTQVLGSRMVDRFMNARMSGTEERQSKIKLNASMNESSSDARKSNIEVRQNNTKLNTSMNDPRIKLNASMNEGSDARRSNIEVRQNNSKFSTSMNEPKIKLHASMNEGSDTRRSNIEVKQSNTKFNTSISESSGFGRLMSKNSLDMALRHMKVQDPPRDAGISHHNKPAAIAGRRASSVSKRLG